MHSQLQTALTNILAVMSPDAFGPEMIQRELARRDQIRDRILLLPVNQREEASQAEAERRRRWQDLRQAHKLRWEAGASGSSSSTGQGAAHRTASYAGSSQALTPSSSGEAAGDEAAEPHTRRTWWKKRASISIPLRYLGRSEG